MSFSRGLPHPRNLRAFIPMAFDLATDLSHQVALALPPLLEDDSSSLGNARNFSENEPESEERFTSQTPSTISKVAMYLCFCKTRAINRLVIILTKENTQPVYFNHITISL